ncbi:hypothetical protein [Sphaerisporangium sp. TRM90804]|uniref:hypothetical protein n=1 Tax=Sphaerisporangium sp. TRM90804 TaxID=3031113 RepID=UPI002448F000|nr:hypothetical protein [Sphaerisporangium sp. TRM90804]MDH2425483.1 hypothetical protein [Sphaerisporangium sp. TRM90804]
MRRSLRTTLGLAAVTAVIAVGVPAAASASAVTTPATAPTTASGFGWEDSWGSYYSKYYNGSRAKAKGHVWEDKKGRMHVDGKLYDKHSPWWLCGYTQVKFEDEDGEESTYFAKKCGSHGARYFHFYEHDVDSIQVRVCYYNDKFDKKKSCGRWNYIYETEES